MAGRMGRGEWALLGLLATCWGGSFFFAKVAGRDVTPITLAFWRVALAAAALWLVAALLGHLRRHAPWRSFVVMGLLNNAIPFSLIFWAQTAITASIASILNAFTPLVTVVVAHLVTRDERLTRGKVVGVLLGLAGIVTLIGPGVLQQAGGHPLHEFAVLAATVSYSLAGLYGRRFRDLPAILPAAGQLTGAALLIAPLAMAVDPGALTTLPSPTSIAAIAGLALISTAAAYVVYFRLLATAGATNLLLVTFLIPPVAIALGVVALDECLTLLQLVGLGGIAAGLFVIDGRWLTRR